MMPRSQCNAVADDKSTPSPGRELQAAARVLWNGSSAPVSEKVTALSKLLLDLPMYEVARLVGLRHGSEMTRLISGEKVDPAARLRLAGLLGVEVTDIWPSDDASLPRPAGRENGSEQREITR